MKLRTSARGPFWGCSKYPNCRGTVDASGANAAAPPSFNNGPRRMSSRYAGRCSNCHSDYAVGDAILYENKQVVGCIACKPGEARYAPTKVAPGARVATFGDTAPRTAWDGLIEDSPTDAVLVPSLVLPPTVEQCAAIPLAHVAPDEHQMKVINWRMGEALVAAGAGSGKSFAMLERLAALVREGCPPERTVTLVYNRKAADELRHRAKVRMGFTLGDRLAIFTFHGWAYTLINEWWPGRFGRGRIIGVDDGPSGLTLAKYAMKEIGLSESMDVKDLVKLSELAREALINFDASDAVEKVCELPTEPTEETAQAIVRFSRAYQTEKAKVNAIDFADMLYMVNRVIDHEGSRARSLSSRYTHVQVDECFPGDTPILLSDGTTKSIKDIVEGTESLPTVLSYDIATKRQIVKRVVGVKKTLLQKRTVRIVARRVAYGADGQRLAPLTEKVRFGYRYLVCTEDHRLFKFDGTEVRASNVRPGDRLHLESSAPQVQSFNHRVKHSMKGRKALRDGIESRDMRHTNNKGTPLVRGGNGKGLTVPQRALLEALGPDWQAEFVVSTNGGRRLGGLPTHYKIDVAHSGCRVAIEVDGESHRSLVRKEADDRKDAFLIANGWQVFRFTNLHVVRNAALIASQMPTACPVEAEVIDVEEWPINDYYVYDLSVEDTHTYYANGLLVHNCQDANAARLRVAVHLAKGARSLVMVGDFRQTIYGFSGARPDLLRSRLDTGATLLSLPINRRSTSQIVEAGNKIAEGRDWNIGGACSPKAETPDAEPVRIWWTKNSGDEADQVVKEVTARIEAEVVLRRDVCCTSCTNALQSMYAQEVSQQQANAAESHIDVEVVSLTDVRRHEDHSTQPRCTRCGSEATTEVRLTKRLNYGAFACLVRTNAQAGDLEIAFTLRKVPCRIIGSKGGIWANGVGKDFLAYLRVANGEPINPDGKPDMDFAKVANKPSRFIKRAVVEDAITSGNIVEHLRSQHSGRVEPLRRLATDIEMLREGSWSEQCRDIKNYLLRDLKERSGQENESITPDEDRAEAIRALHDLAIEMGSVAAIDAQIQLMKKVSDKDPAVEICTAHRCVDELTLIETRDGVMMIRDAISEGVVATPSGAQKFINKTVLEQQTGLQITTEDGYALTVTPEHGMSKWTEGEWERVRADALKDGDYLRLKLGVTCTARLSATLPPAPVGNDVRTRIYAVPTHVTEEVAEFLGLLVADGTVFKSGFRLVKRYQSVTQRFSRLVQRLFDVTAREGNALNGNAFVTEVSSTFLSKWLLQIDGVAPNSKAVPTCILRSPINIQAAFLRGLFEDGTVNTDGQHVDHLHWENRDPRVASTVQYLLLRLGIISAVKHRRSNDHPISTVYIYGQNAKRFFEKVGFVADEKNAKSVATYSAETHYRIPLTYDEASALRGLIIESDLTNARARGYITREVARKILESSNTPFDLIDLWAERLAWHYVRVRKIQATTCRPMCLEVPSGSRFLQNGFDGWNSKGAEWEVVFVCGAAVGLMPHHKSRDEEEERRLFYVAVTRAKSVCVISIGSKQPSPFLRAFIPDLPEAKAVPPIVRRKATGIVEVLTPEESRGELVRSIPKEMLALFGQGGIHEVDIETRHEILKKATTDEIQNFIEKFKNGTLNEQE